jgi:phosphopantetheine adenylyltransferase
MTVAKLRLAFESKIKKTLLTQVSEVTKRLENLEHKVKDLKLKHQTSKGAKRRETRLSLKTTEKELISLRVEQNTLQKQKKINRKRIKKINKRRLTELCNQIIDATLEEFPELSF